MDYWTSRDNVRGLLLWEDGGVIVINGLQKPIF